MFLCCRHRATLFIACAFLLVLSVLPQQPARRRLPTFTSAWTASASASSSPTLAEQFVGGLRREDFQVFDDGVEQPITDFLSVDEPAQVLLLIEAGPAVYLLQGGHLQAIHALLDGLSPSDRVAIARYDETAEPILNFTPDKFVAAGALDQLRFNLGFGQLNLASSLATALDWLARVPGKKSLVLLSTGVDTSPPAAAQNLLARLKSTDVRLLAVSLGGELRVSQSAEKKHSRKDLSRSRKNASRHRRLWPRPMKN